MPQWTGTEGPNFTAAAGPLSPGRAMPTGRGTGKRPGTFKFTELPRATQGGVRYQLHAGPARPLIHRRRRVTE